MVRSRRIWCGTIRPWRAPRKKPRACCSGMRASGLTTTHRRPRESGDPYAVPVLCKTGGCGKLSFNHNRWWLWLRLRGDDTLLGRSRYHAIAAIVLGAVERGVGALQHIADRLALELERRQPDRDRDLDADRALVDRERFAGDRTPQPLRDHARDVQIGLWHHDHKFLAAIAAGQIDAADRLADPDCEFAQYVVAGIMAVFVVDRFEKIDVEHHQRQRLAAARGLLGKRTEMALHVTAVMQAGQRVGDRHLDGVLHVVAQMIGIAPLANLGTSE